MARMTKAAIKEREDFVKELIKKNSDILGIEIQTALMDKFGSKMRNARLFGLRLEVRNEQSDEKGTWVPSDSHEKLENILLGSIVGRG